MSTQQGTEILVYHLYQILQSNIIMSFMKVVKLFNPD